MPEAPEPKYFSRHKGKKNKKQGKTAEKQSEFH